MRRYGRLASLPFIDLVFFGRAIHPAGKHETLMTPP